MKKIFTLLMAFCCVLCCFAQRSMSEYVVSPAMYQQFSQAEVEQYRQSNPAELLRLNYKMNNYAVVVAKLFEDNYQMMGFIEKYAQQGTTPNEDEIVNKGYLNPFQYNFPQDDYKYNVFQLHRSGFYVVVMPKYLYNERLAAHMAQFGF